MARRSTVVVAVLVVAVFAAIGCSVEPGPSDPAGTTSVPSTSVPSTAPETGPNRVSVLLTTGDRSKLLSIEPSVVIGTDRATAADIEIDATQLFQVIDGVGAALTDSAALAIDGLAPAPRTALLQDLFGPGGADLNYVRVPLSSTDFSTDDHTYDDVEAPGSDEDLSGFSLAVDEQLRIPLLQQIAATTPDLRLMGTPWSAPGWMKTGNDTTRRRGLIGGTLDDRYVQLYGDYLTRIVTGFAAHGLRVDTLTLQNEPDFAPSDYAGMLLSPAQEARLAAATRDELDAAGATGTRLLGHDHNWDGAARALELLDEPGATDALDGVAFHCYGGDPAAQATVHDAHPGADVYLTECTGTRSSGTFASNLLWNTEVLLIDGTRNWARSVLLWNLALDEQSGPRVGGCPDCRGVVTVDSTTGAITKNEEFYALGQLARGIDPGARRVASTGSTGSVHHVAFENPDGSHTLLASNAASNARTLTVGDADRGFTYTVPARSVATLRWEPAS